MASQPGREQDTDGRGENRAPADPGELAKLREEIEGCQAELNRLRKAEADQRVELSRAAEDLKELAVSNSILKATVLNGELRIGLGRKQLAAASAALLEIVLENINSLRRWGSSSSWRLANTVQRFVSRPGGWGPMQEAATISEQVERLETMHGRAGDGHIPIEKLVVLRRRSTKAVKSLEASLSLQFTGPLRGFERLSRTFGFKRAGSRPASLHGRPADTASAAGKAAKSVPGDEVPPVAAAGDERSGQPSLAIYYSSLGNYFFREISILLLTGVRKLGFTAELRTEMDGWSGAAELHLVVAPHEYFFLGEGAAALGGISSDKLLLLNTEQQQTPWFQRALATFSSARHVFDLHLDSVKTIQRLGFKSSHLPLGYVDGFPLYSSTAPLPLAKESESLSSEASNWLDSDLPLSARPIDVSFVGEANFRRALFFSTAAPYLERFECHLRLLPQIGPRTAPVEDRDLRTRLTSGISRRSKIVLNVHRDEAPYFEWHRIVLMGIWQKALVITETVNDAPPFVAGEDFVQAPLGKLPMLIDYYLRDPGGIREAERIRNAGFKKLTDACSLTEALSASLRPILNDFA